MFSQSFKYDTYDGFINLEIYWFGFFEVLVRVECVCIYVYECLHAHFLSKKNIGYKYNKMGCCSKNVHCAVTLTR
jgi:hypothetical protein